MEIEKNNNKELVPLEHYLEEYAKADQAEISRRTGMPYDAEKHQFTVHFFGRSYAVGYPEFTVQPLNEAYAFDALSTMNPAKILVVRFLLESAATQGTGKFLTYREVPWGEVYYRQFNGRCMLRLAYGFGNKLDAFRKAMETMHAEPVKAADVAYQVEVFPGYFVQFLLWEGDEEFAPSSQILFSDNFPAGFHAEDLVVVCDVLITILKNLQ